jgi:hypothetical protein
MATPILANRTKPYPLKRCIEQEQLLAFSLQHQEAVTHELDLIHVSHRVGEEPQMETVFIFGSFTICRMPTILLSRTE